MTIHICPRCGLRFAYAGELRDHLLLDHPVVVPAPAPDPRVRRQ